MAAQLVEITIWVVVICVAAAFLAGLMSSVDSFLNSTATVWTNDLTAEYVHENSAYAT